MPTTGMCPRGCASDGLDTAIRTRMRVAMIPTVLTCMFLSSLQPTEGAAERRSDRVRAYLPYECLNEGLQIHILDIIANKKRHERLRKRGLRHLPPAGGG